MSNNNGKFFDVGDTSLFFTDIEDATTYFELCANYFFEDVETFENTEAWQGEDAEVAKKVLGGTEKQLLLDIIQLHKDMKEVNAAIIDNFGLMVDKAADGHIEYDVVEKIRNDFQDMRAQFEDELKLVVNKHSELSRFEKYGSFSEMNFTEQKDRFVQFCGAGSNNYSGYLGECLHKLIFFDSDAKSYIKDMDFESRIDDINSRMCQFVISHCPESQAAQYIDDIDKFEEVYLAEKAEATINSDVCTWRVMDIVIMVNWYNKALEEGDTETLEKFYNALNESELVSTNNKGIPTKLDGKNYDQYVAYMQPEKTYLLMLFDAGMGYGETEGFQQLYTLSQATVICEVPTGTEAPKFGVKVGEIPQGLVVNWGATYKEEGILSNYQGVIFNQDGLSYDQKYDLIEEEEKVEDYRDNLKIVKDATRVAELEKKCIFADENSSAAQYHEGLKSENDDSGRYRYINDINYQLGALCSNAAGGCSEYLDDALGFMTEEQIRNYNYLYYQDSINGTDYADEYIDLLIPSLRQKAAAAQYEGIKDSTALKAVYEVGIGLDSISTGIENVFGLNDDRDGVAVQSTYEYLDGMIMSSAKTKGEMYLYTGSKVVGAAIPGVGIAVATGGAGAVGLVAGAVGSGVLYGVSTGGNSKAQAEREGYTESQAVAYGTAVGIEEAVKSSAMSVVGGSGRFVSGIPTPVGALGAGVTGFTMEYVDEAYINPAIRANILNDEAAYNIDYKQVLINSGIAGVLVGGTYFIESVAASKNATEVVSGENSEEYGLKARLDQCKDEAFAGRDIDGNMSPSTKQKLVDDLKRVYDETPKENRGDNLVPEKAEFLNDPPIVENIKTGERFDDVNYKWPLNGGFEGEPSVVVPKEGDCFDRIGSESGRYVAPLDGGSPQAVEKRGLPYHLTEDNVVDEASYHAYEVDRDFGELQDAINEYYNPELTKEENEFLRSEFQKEYNRNNWQSDEYSHEPGKTYYGNIAAAFDGGGGTQLELPMSVESLKELGMIHEIRR